MNANTEKNLKNRPSRKAQKAQFIRTVRRIKSQEAVDFLDNIVAGLDPISEMLDGVIYSIYKIANEETLYEFTYTTGIPYETLAPLKDRIDQAVKQIENASSVLNNLATEFGDVFSQLELPDEAGVEEDDEEFEPEQEPGEAPPAQPVQPQPSRAPAPGAVPPANQVEVAPPLDEDLEE